MMTCISIRTRRHILLLQAKTGEEDEEVTFSERCKLFRMIDSQWKERGIGELKILRHKTKQSYRLVMRREQVLKLCANHKLHAGMKLAQVRQVSVLCLMRLSCYTNSVSSYIKVIQG